MKQYVFDGSWTGLLTAVFECFERRERNVRLVHTDHYQPQMFDESFIVFSEDQKASRVDRGLQKCLKQVMYRKLFCTFLSGLPECYNLLLHLMIRIFSGEEHLMDNYGDEAVLYVTQTAKSVEREKHRMKAFVRFEKTDDGMFFALVEPDFNVLPLIVDFFRNRYADQNWLIYDTKRKYGLYYDQRSVAEVTIGAVSATPHSIATIAYDTDEEQYKTLWREYFRSTNIPARRNMKLHLQHVPRRYWKYLVEKKPE
ncbi:TIGR03915 family putative DNA repair protein [Rurimicrobium arvi]|uniref:TIGR03915 family putative DNA repair protein n=1 Tax=Rurimicrobium arvi TaxID=2049916 RepID=A0ABP8MQ20_9BACT